MKHLLKSFLILFLFCSVSALAQKAGSLKQRLSEADTDTTRVILLARLGFEYAFINLDTSRQYCNKAIKLAKTIDFKRGQADAVNNLAISYDVEGDHETALAYFLEALDLYERIGIREGQARIYNNCGMVYQNLGDLNKSLEYHSKSLNIEKELQDSIGVAYSLIHIAGIYVDLDSLESASDRYISAQLILEAKEDNDGLSYVYLGLGELNFTRDMLNKSLSYFDKALNLFEEEQNKKGISETLLLIGKTHMANGDYATSENLFLDALNESKTLEAQDVVAESLSSLVSLYQEKGDYRKAFEHFQEYSILQDSIQREEMRSNIIEIQSKYDFEKQSKELIILNAEKEFQTTLRNVFIGVLLVFAVLLIILYRTYLFKSKALSILKAKNEEIKRKNVLIETEKRNALEAARVKSDFLSVMSHEIRTPMNAIIGSTHLLLSKDPKPEQIENLNILKFSSDNLLVLLNDILDINKLDSDNITFESIRFSLSQLTQGLAGVYRKQAQSKGIDFELTIPERIPTDLIGDPGRLFQVLNNLISNAIKFTERGIVKLTISLVSLNRDKVNLKFLVEDTGIGIEEEKIHMIFDDFSQADSNTTRKYGGTGLGLSITKRILELLGSEVFVESKVGSGSKFYFELPLNIYSGFEFQNFEDEEIKHKINNINDKKVLVVDDSRTNLLITKSILSKWGLESTLVESALEALDELFKGQFDLMLIDLRMPDMDGYMLTKKVRELKENTNSNVPIVAISATVASKIREKVIEHGMNDYLAKPFDPSKLLEIIYNQTVVVKDEPINKPL